MSFYEALQNETFSIPKDDKLMLLGDFNARVGKNHATWNASGRHGIGKINYNGVLLLHLCSEFNLAICNPFFRLKLKHKVTWTHPRSKHGHVIDYIITRKDNIGMRILCVYYAVQNVELIILWSVESLNFVFGKSLGWLGFKY